MGFREPPDSSLQSGKYIEGYKCIYDNCYQAVIECGQHPRDPEESF